MPVKESELDKLFCKHGKTYGIKKHLLKAVGIVESSLNDRSYRYEPAFWRRYLADNPEWKNENPAEVSASYGIMQLMFTTAHQLGFRGAGDDLFDPDVNIGLGAKLLNKLITKVRKSKAIEQFPHLVEWEVALALYNGGGTGNPSSDGKLRNQKYANKVMAKYYEIMKKEKDCEEV